jgi:hypothetical protein
MNFLAKKRKAVELDVPDHRIIILEVALKWVLLAESKHKRL